jgi:hypothetical protein
MSITVLQILKEYLAANGYAGLYCDGNCSLADSYCSLLISCQAGYSDGLGGIYPEHQTAEGASLTHKIYDENGKGVE